MKKVHIIAEIGSNHNGSFECARQYIEAAKASGADSAKLQTITKPLLMSPKTLISGKIEEYPIYNLFNCSALSDESHLQLAKFSRDINFQLFSAPFYLEAVDLLESMKVSQYKIASGDIGFVPLLERVGATNKKVILSTGASDLVDIEKAMSILTNSGCPEVVLLHCVSNYPPAWNEMNLNVITTLKSEFGTSVGISDHSPGSVVPIASVALGATYIEKHVTFDRTLNGPDHPYAMTFPEFTNMVNDIRLLELAMGDGIKVPSPAEQEKQWRIRRAPYDPTTHEPSDKSDAVWLRPDYRLNN